MKGATIAVSVALVDHALSSNLELVAAQATIRQPRPGFRDPLA
jgi:hypothetical protein